MSITVLKLLILNGFVKIKSCDRESITSLILVIRLALSCMRVLCLVGGWKRHLLD